jgi:ketosteroid isomerase-like protein
MAEESTTPDLVELTRRAFEAASCRDFDRLMSFFAEDATWGAIPLEIRFEGRAAIREFLEGWLAPYEAYTIEPEEVVEQGNGVMFVVAVQEGRPTGAAASARVREIWSYVGLWKDGIVMQLDAYEDGDQARAEAERLAHERGGG